MRKHYDNEYRKKHYEAANDNDKIILNFLNINRTLHLLYEGKASQKRILIILSEEETITQQRLTERLGIMPGSASEILAKLEKGGLILRSENPDDRRTAIITLTEEGCTLAKEALEQRQNRHKEMLSCLSSEEQSGLLSLLEKLNADWEERYKGANADRHQGHHHRQHGECSGNCHECTHPCRRGKDNGKKHH